MQVKLDFSPVSIKNSEFIQKALKILKHEGEFLSEKVEGKLVTFIRGEEFAEGYGYRAATHIINEEGQRTAVDMNIISGEVFMNRVLPFKNAADTVPECEYHFLHRGNIVDIKPDGSIVRSDYVVEAYNPFRRNPDYLMNDPRSTKIKRTMVIKG